MNLAQRIVSNIFTERDNVTACGLRILIYLGIIVYLGLSIYYAIDQKTFGYKEFAEGLGIVWAAAGAAITAKATTEAKP